MQKLFPLSVHHEAPCIFFKIKRKYTNRVKQFSLFNPLKTTEMMIKKVDKNIITRRNV